MREIREYNMNGTIILGVDNGYGNVKTAHRVFPTGIMKCDSEPVLSKEYIEYEGAYYIIGEGHKGFVADKQEDDDTYILTLAAIAKELEARGLTEARIHLAVGLPLKWVQAQRDSFKQYLTRKRYVSLKYRKVNYLIEIVDCTVMPQGYAAVAENLKDFKGMNLLVDVGNGTMNVMYLNNSRPIESKSWTEKLGVNQCFIRIQNRIMDRTGTKLPDEIINDFLRYGDADACESYLSAMKQVAEAMGFKSADDMLVNIGSGKENPMHVANRMLKILVDKGTEEAEKPLVGMSASSTGKMPPMLTSVKRPKKHETHASNGVVVRGIDDVLVRLSRCCNPVPGDKIIGFVTRGRGVSVHREDCPNAVELKQHPERIIEVHWEDSVPDAIYNVEIIVEALDRMNLLIDVASVLSEYGANMLNVSSTTHRDGMAEMRFLFQISDISKIERILSKLQAVEGVFDARRMMPGNASK